MPLPKPNFPEGSAVKNLLTMQETPETLARSLAWEDPLEKEIATHSSNLAWEVPRTEELGRLQSTGSKESDMIEHTHSEFST